eukprot:TRINITY_DN10748_c0_g1_i1.p1 TRINITY_DN10748_c0_g1~~TRINITY_DN10748_c0_g1_i1.p1  ORF type:complete len:285 (+),score=107.12 TRINITY_DN10748_c0_g1_i1:35-889(+)
MKVLSGSAVDFAFSKEDRWFVVDEENDWKLYGVLDGHGGKQAVEHITRNMPELLLDAVRSVGTDDADMWERGVRAAVRSCFERVENRVLSETEDDSGACVTLVMVSCEDLPSIVINLGDCRAAIVHPDGNVHHITTDHQLSSATERDRIRALGYTPIGNRVAGLEPTRTIGDADIKCKVPEGVVSCVPEISFHDFTAFSSTVEDPKKGGKKKKVPAAGSSVFLILATDGVWGTIDGIALGNAARRALFKKAKANPTASARAVTELARLRGSIDDITTLALYLEY